MLKLFAVVAIVILKCLAYGSRDEEKQSSSFLEDLKRNNQLLNIHDRLLRGRRLIPKVAYRNLTLGRSVTGLVNSSISYTYIYTYREEQNETQVFRITTSSNDSSLTFPTLFVVRRQRGILSWQIPLLLQSSNNNSNGGDHLYDSVSRTLCPLQAKLRKGQTQSLFVDVSTYNFSRKFDIKLEKVQNFHIRKGRSMNTTISPATPEYFTYKFGNEDSVLIKIESPDDLCMKVSVQDIKCPVFDLTRNIEYTGIYQTVQRRAGLTIAKREFPEGFFLVFVASLSKSDCTKSVEKLPTSDAKKSISFVVKAALPKSKYWEPVLFAIAWFLLFYIVALVICCICYFTFKKNVSQPLVTERNEEDETRNLLDGMRSPIIASEGGADGYGATSDMAQSTGIPHVIRRQSSDSSLNEDDFDTLNDAESDKNVFRAKTVLHVSDLSRKNSKRLSKKYRLYLWNLLTISVFYCLPVIQLVFTYQKVLNKTGNEDLCYYNFYCALPLGQLTAFNNVFSNIGYVMLGVLFLILVFRREMIYRQTVIFNPTLETKFGIPQHFGLFYAMGYALIMEGILSGCYHVCPSYNNFQFDTAFMYMIAWLLMLKIYQIRHPDINAHSHTAYFILACVIFLSVIGVVSSTKAFWIIVSFVHIFVVFMFSIHIYYMGRWKLDLTVFKRLYFLFRTDILTCSRPTYFDRFLLLSIVNSINIGLAIYGMIMEPTAFALWLLAIFIINLLLYFAFYIIMKLRSKEKIKPLPLIFTIIASILWAFSFKFFLTNLTDWHTTPSLSRRNNAECILFKFYDSHDIWHFFSSMSLFFSFMVLLTLDDDLCNTPREKIAVF